MAWDKHERKKMGIRHIRWVLLILIGIIWLTQSQWRPYLDNWRCANIAAEISKKYGLVVRYGNPSEFYVPPKQVINYKMYHMEIEQAEKLSALIALRGVREALAMYPSVLIKNCLSAVFISGAIKNYGVQGAGTYAYSWIYVSATSQFDQLGSHYYAETLHHELSSLFIKKPTFATERWKGQNPPNFNYLKNHIDVLQASSAENRQDQKNAKTWLLAGFVHDYGMASLENDFNTYAELAMAQPERLKELAQKYPRIKAKTAILVEFYTSLAPELGAYFKSVGLED